MKVSEQFVLLAGTANKLKYHSKLTTVAAVIYDLILDGAVKLDEKNRLVINQQSVFELTNYEEKVYNLIKKYSPVKMFILIGKIYAELRACGIHKDVMEGLNSQKIDLEKKTHSIIEELRADVLEDGTMSEESSILLLLMKQSKCMNYYFSNHESSIVSDKLKSLKSSNEFRFYSILRKTIVISDLLTWS